MLARALAFNVFVLLAAQAASATTTVIFDTSTGITPLSGDGPVSDNTTIAGDSFTAGSLGFNTVALSLSADNPSDDGSVSVYLYADDGSGGSNGVAGAPTGTGLLLGTIVDSALPATLTGNIGLLSLTFSVPAGFTTSDNEYWVLADMTGSSAELYYNVDGSGFGTASQDIASNASGSVSGPLLANTDGNGAYAMIVSEATTTSTGIPEPATAAILGVGFAGLGLLRRHKPRL